MTNEPDPIPPDAYRFLAVDINATSRYERQENEISEAAYAWARSLIRQPDGSLIAPDSEERA